MTNSSQSLIDRREAGVALVIVLAFLVLLTGITVAYFGRTATSRQLSSSSFNQVKADVLARSAAAVIIGDLKQEILNGTPVTAANIAPQRSPLPTAGSTPAIANLVRRSVRSDLLPAPAVPSRASSVNSTTDVSINGRFVSLTRWNRHYLVPKANTGDDSSDPTSGGAAFAAPAFWAPDWVLVTRNGPMVQTGIGSGGDAINNPVSTNGNYVTGRYAYAIYDEGGLLDFNVAGYPYPSPSPATTPLGLVKDIGRKGSLALADLTGIRLTAAGATANQPSLTRLVAWRNFATVQASGTFPALASSDQTQAPFIAFAVGSPQVGITTPYTHVATTTYNNRTDQAFLNRRQLIDLIRATGGSVNLLQFLGTFSRERNAPTWKAGTAALTGRFYLAHLALVKPNPTAAQIVDIQKYFGLKWTPGAAGGNGPATPGRWQYVGSSGSTMLDKIPAFSSSADFFQLLNYATNRTNADDATNIAQTLGLGAAIIDQYDDDTAADPITATTTTMIEYNGGWAVGLENTDPARPTTSPAPSPFPSPGGMSPTPAPAVAGYVMLNRPFRNVGEFGYAFRGSASPTPIPSPTPKTVDFVTATSIDAPLLDLFTYNQAPVRAGVVNLNTRNAGVIAAILRSAITSESTSATVGLAAANNAAASPAPSPVVGVVSHSTNGTLSSAAVGRHEIARLVAATATTLGATEEAKETVARALSEVSQTRTWGLLIDVIAQSGRYPRTASSLADFVVEGEQRYWLHIAIDRFTGEVIDQQLEAVYE